MIIIKEAKTKEELLKAFFLRRKVLVDEFKYSIYDDEPDQDDLTARIYVTVDNGLSQEVIGTVRVKKENGWFRIQRMAIAKRYRKKGLGTKLMKRILDDYKDKKIYLMSPKVTIQFYQKFGFKKTDVIQKGKFHDYYRLENFSNP